MRKLDLERKEKSIKGILLVLILVLSVAGFGFLSSRPSTNEAVQKYNGLDFTKSGEFWILNLEGREFYFYNLPQNLENVSIEGNFSLDSYYQKALYFVNDSSASGLIKQNLQGIYLKQQGACYLEPCGKDLPTKDCSSNLIIFSEGENKVSQNQSCVFIEGDFRKGVDVFMYKLLDII